MPGSAEEANKNIISLRSAKRSRNKKHFMRTTYPVWNLVVFHRKSVKLANHLAKLQLSPSFLNTVLRNVHGNRRHTCGVEVND